MTYNLLIVKNRYTKKFTLQKCYDWFKQEVGLDFVVDEIKTDFDLTTLNVGNATFKGVVAGNLHEVLKSVVPPNKYHAVVVVYGNDLHGVRVSATNITGPLYPSTDIIQLAKVTWQTLNHELFHTFFGRCIRAGIPVQDNMDTYLRDNILDTDNGSTNRTIALQTLKPYWNIITNMNPTPIVTITRTYTDAETFGTLIAAKNGMTFTCKTLELPWKDNQHNISCIPEGSYKATYTFRPTKLKSNYLLQNVPGRSGVFIHLGNYASAKKTDVQGCILLGEGYSDINNDHILDIHTSTLTVKAFEKFMAGEPFTLIVQK